MVDTLWPLVWIGDVSVHEKEFLRHSKATKKRESGRKRTTLEIQAKWKTFNPLHTWSPSADFFLIILPMLALPAMLLFFSVSFNSNYAMVTWCWFEKLLNGRVRRRRHSFSFIMFKHEKAQVQLTRKLKADIIGRCVICHIQLYTKLCTIFVCWNVWL